MRGANRARHLFVGLTLAIAGCSSRSSTSAGRSTGLADVASTGSARVGRALIGESSCGTCHVIPGVAGARGLVGPTLAEFGRRDFIAGVLRNTPENLVRWVVSPQSIKPGVAMPDLGITPRDAADIAAYLYTLR
jgi:cytochrome c2